LLAVSKVPKSALAEYELSYWVCLGKGSGVVTIGKMEDERNVEFNSMVKVPFRVVKGEYYLGITGIQIMNEVISLKN
jgi:hypothetical protein